MVMVMRGDDGLLLFEMGMSIRSLLLGGGLSCPGNMDMDTFLGFVGNIECILSCWLGRFYGLLVVDGVGVGMLSLFFYPAAGGLYGLFAFTFRGGGAVSCRRGYCFVDFCFKGVCYGYPVDYEEGGICKRLIYEDRYEDDCPSRSHLFLWESTSQFQD